MAGGCYELRGHPSNGFGFQLDTTPADCARYTVSSITVTTASITPSPSSVPCCSDREIFKVVSLLLELGIAHNLVMLRGEPFNCETAANGKAVVRSLLIPRKPALGKKYLALNYS